jgi:hypothetical protein
MPVLALLGWDGGELAGLASERVIVRAPYGEYFMVESMHVVMCDVLCRWIIGHRDRDSVPKRQGSECDVNTTNSGSDTGRWPGNAFG